MSDRESSEIRMIDGNYIIPRRAAAYLIVDGEEAAFFDTITRFSVPALLKELEAAGRAPEDVRYIIASHVHLDHSGGTAELAKYCPNATVICHPRAKRHIVDPSKLVAAARPIYGEDAFEEIFGEIEPVDEGRVRDVQEGESLPLGGRTLEVYHTPGHARHHMAVHDRGANVFYAGDAFGIAQRKLQERGKVYVSYVVSPPDFSADDAKESVRKIAESGADRVCVTHFGDLTDIEVAAHRLFVNIDALDALINELSASDAEGDALHAAAQSGVENITRKALNQAGLDPSDDDVWFWANTESNITTQGVAFMAERRREEAKA